MTIFPFGIFSIGTEEDLGKKGQIDEARVADYSARLFAAESNQNEFDQVLSELVSDPVLRSGEMQLIAVRYRGGGKKPTTRKAAISAIATRFAEILRFDKNNRIAEKVRPL